MKKSIFLSLITDAVLCFCVFAANAQSERKYNRELITSVSMYRSLNVCSAQALNNALVRYAENAGSYVRGIDGIYPSSYSCATINADNCSLRLGYDFTGKMDNFRACNWELMATEIIEIYNAKQ